LFTFSPVFLLPVRAPRRSAAPGCVWTHTVHRESRPGGTYFQTKKQKAESNVTRAQPETRVEFNTIRNNSELPDGVGALLIGGATFLLTNFQAVGTFKLIRPRWSLFPRYAIVEAADILPILFGAVGFVFARLANWITLATHPYNC